MDLRETSATIYPSPRGPRRTAHTDLMFLMEWASDYQRHNLYPKTPFERFAIALYQHSQAAKWKKAGERSQAWEGYASVSLHLLMLAEAIKWKGKGIPVDHALDADTVQDAEEILFRWSRAQQIVFYWHIGCRQGEERYQRASRINLNQLGKDLFLLIHHYRALIPPAELSASIEQASDIMCGKL